MRRVWVFALIAVLAVSAIVAGSAGYLYLSDSEKMEDKSPEEGDYEYALADKPDSKQYINKKANLSDRGTKNESSFKKYVNKGGVTKKRYINKPNADMDSNWVLEEGNVSLDHAGTYEVTKFPNSKPTPEQLHNAWRLYNRSYNAAKEQGWFDIERGVEDGYDILTDDDIHYFNPEYIIKGGTLNPYKPETLIYYDDPQNKNNKILAGYMYYTLDGEGYQLGGPLTIWHYHIAPDIIEQEELKYVGPGEKKSLNFSASKFNDTDDFRRNGFFQDTYDGKRADAKTREMIHVWFVRHPRGPFGSTMSVPQENLEEPKKMSEEEFKNHLMKKYEKIYEPD